jgi:thiol-disulfide isomerase/thioredoxin
VSAALYGRLLLAAGLCLFGMLAWNLVNRRLLARSGSRVAAFDDWSPGLPAILYFTTPSCAPCRTVQRPTIRKLEERLGKWFQVIEVDAAARPELAEEWGVLSVPTTFIIDGAGKPRFVNHGIASAEKLIRQLELEDYSI